MTPEAQRIAIANQCGWKRRPEFDYKYSRDGLSTRTAEMWGRDTGELIPFEKLPDYPNDLNAMHEAEEVLTDGRCSTFAEILDQILDAAVRSGMPAAGCFLWHATAAQRAEAFLRALNLWKD